MTKRSARTLGLRLVLAMLAAGTDLVTGQASAQGTIAFFRPAQPIPVVYTSFPGSFDFDVNGDGIADYHFNLADGLGVSVDPLGNNRQVAVPAIPPNLGSDLDPLPAGFQIGSSLAPTYTWVSPSSPGLAGHSLISSVAIIDGNLVTSGLFSGQTAYMGIEFLIGQDAHYGWVLIESPGGTAGGFINEWAYETRPGASILAGAVPEPSCISLCVLGILLMFTRRSKSRVRL